jgi:hypothetical protein
MSNPLKRVLNPVEKAGDVTINVSAVAMVGVDPRPPDQQYCGSFPDAPRQSQYHGPSYMNPERYGTPCNPHDRY